MFAFILAVALFQAPAQDAPKADAKNPPVLTQEQKDGLQELIDQARQVSIAGKAKEELLNDQLNEKIARIESRYHGYTINPRTLELVPKNSPNAARPQLPVNKPAVNAKTPPKIDK